MHAVRTRPLRAATLVAVAAIALHQLRYAIAFGHRGVAVEALQGHGYLGIAMPLLAAVAGVALALTIWRRASGAGEIAPRATWARTWAALSAVLLAVYVLQELAEGALDPSHPAGLAGALGGGGW